MKKINLFYILAFEEQTYKYEKNINKIINLDKKGIKKHFTTNETHFFMLSKYFNIYNFFKYKDKIANFENSIIYHIPNGVDFETWVEKILLKYKGKIPIVMRSYDPHSPLKTSDEYMREFHDLTITYLNTRVNNQDIIFWNMCYDNYLISKFKFNHNRKGLACMILRNRVWEWHNLKHEKFLEKWLDLKKNYKERQEIIKRREIDIYWQWWPVDMINYCGTISPFDQKYTILSKYKFNFIFDTAIVDSFISEKILDSFLTLTIPVYLGSPTISNYIPKWCYIDISSYKNYDDLLYYLNNMSDEEYNWYVNCILNSRDNIFNSFSTKENISKLVYDWYNIKHKTNLGLSNGEYIIIEDDINWLRFKSSSILISNFRRKIWIFMGKVNKIIKK